MMITTLLAPNILDCHHPGFRIKPVFFHTPQAVQGEGNNLKIVKWQLFLYALSSLHSSLPFKTIDVFLSGFHLFCIMTVHQWWRLFLFPYHLILQITLNLPESRSIVVGEMSGVQSPFA